MTEHNLIPGLKFARRFDMTQKEIQVLIPFLKRPYTTQELAEKLNVNKNTLHHTIQRLKLKHLLVLKERNERGTNLYEFNEKAVPVEAPSPSST